MKELNRNYAGRPHNGKLYFRTRQYESDTLDAFQAKMSLN